MASTGWSVCVVLGIPEGGGGKEGGGERWMEGGSIGNKE